MLPCFGAQLEDMQLADHVGQRLPGPDDVAVHFGVDILSGECRIVLHVADGALAAPAIVMNAGVHHQAHGAPHLIIQIAEFGVGGGVKAEFVAQRFGIQRPAFAVHVVVGEAAKRRQAAQLHRDRNLKLVAGAALVTHQHLDVVFWPAAGVVQIYPDITSHAAIPGGRYRIGGIGVGCECGRNRTHAIGHPWQNPGTCDPDQIGIDPLGGGAVGFEQCLRIFVVEPGVGAQIMEEIAIAAFEADFFEYRFHFAADPSDLFQPQPMHLCGGHAGGGEMPYQIGVVGLATGQARYPY